MSELVRVGIAGIGGRMGRLLDEEVRAVPELTLVGGIGRDGDISELAAQSDVVIDFTNASTVRRHAAALTAAGTAWILGTSGLSPEDQAAVDEAARVIRVVQRANFAPGIALLLELAERMGAALPAAEWDAEIVEMHHRNKVDAPSGTALALGAAVAAGRGVDLAQMRESGRDGQTGARRPGAIGFSAMRGGAVVGEHTLLFAADGEQIAITHRAFDRRAFARGAVKAAVLLTSST